MTEYEAYQEHIRYTHDTYCRIVIRHASFDAARMLAARWKREISLEYLTEEKFVLLSTTDEYFQVPDYSVIDSRYRSGKPLIATTNLTLEELQHPQDTPHARIYDRLTSMCAPVRFTGSNFRKETAQEKLERLKQLMKQRKESL